MKEKYLPIGTVCLLKGGTKKVMIAGFCAVDNNNKEKMYDYSGCMYPEGFLSSDQTALFDHEQIEKVFFEGYIDEDETAFKTQLKTIISKINNVVPTPSATISPPAEPSPTEQPVITQAIKLDETPVEVPTKVLEEIPVTTQNQSVEEIPLESIPPIGPGL